VPSKDPETQKDVVKTDKSGDRAGVEKLTILHKHRSSLADTMHFRRPVAPASSVNADIVGTSTLHSATLPKQESSTATSKGYTFREGSEATHCCSINISSSTMFFLETFALTSSVGERVRYVGQAQPSAAIPRYRLFYYHPNLVA
jgi:hypothetical protein